MYQKISRVNTNSTANFEDLAGIKSGKILILGDNPATALLMKQAFHAEFVTPGSAIGGSFDREVTECYSIGDVKFEELSGSIILAQTQQGVKIAEAKLAQVKAGSKTGNIKAQEAK